MLDAILKFLDPVQLLLGVLACALTQAVMSYFHTRPLRRKMEFIKTERDHYRDLVDNARDNYAALHETRQDDTRRIDDIRADLDDFIASTEPVLDAARRIVDADNSYQAGSRGSFIVRRQVYLDLQMALIKFDAAADPEPEPMESDAPVFLPLLMNQET